MAQRTLLQLSRSVSSMTTVSIVGTAGRRKDGEKMNKQVFHQMVEKAKEVITKEFKLKLEETHLVSGGAAWADHVAVILFLEGQVPNLTLHLPTKWETTENSQCYQESDTKNDPGKTANKLHRHFGSKLGENTLQQLEMAFLVGATKRIHNGFKERNNSVASSDYFLAFTWGEGDEPKKGGTSDTWKKCSGKKLHVPLSSLMCTSKDSVVTEQQYEYRVMEELSSEEDIDSAYSSGGSLEQVPSSLPCVADQALPSNVGVESQSTLQGLSYMDGLETDKQKSSDFDAEGSSPCSSTKVETSESVTRVDRKRLRESECDSSSEWESDIERDGPKNCTIEKIHPKKIKLSTFANQVMNKSS